MTPTETERALAMVCLDLLRRCREISVDLEALRRVVADRGILISPEELGAATQAVEEVFDLERALRPAAERAPTVLDELVQLLHRILKEPETPPPPA